MQRRSFLKGIAAGTGLVALNWDAALAGPPEDKPNIILCMADDQGWGDMAYNGHKTLKTPHFDAMAKEAMRFDRFYAAAPVCSPTRGSVLTGRHPNRFGCFSWGHSLRPQEVTIAEALKKAGYQTGHFGKWHLGSVLKGSPVNPGASGFDEWLSAPNFFDLNPILSREGVAVKTKGESSMVTVDAALAFIRKNAKAQKPFAAVVWFGSPHNPHKGIKQDLETYKDNKKLAPFYGEITAMDRAFGKLRAELKTLGIRDNTILWFCSDNGGLKGKGVTGGRGHKGSIYEGGLRVPALLEWPARIPKPTITNVPCNTSDFYPTLLEITGVKMEKQPPLDGISLVPLIDGKMETRPAPMGFWSHPTPGKSTPSDQWMTQLFQAQNGGKEVPPSRKRMDAAKIKKQYPEDSFPGHAAWLAWPWKLHSMGGKKGKIELYNLAEDAMEKKDVAAEQVERVKTMKEALTQWQTSVIRSCNGKDY